MADDGSSMAPPHLEQSVPPNIISSVHAWPFKLCHGLTLGLKTHPQTMFRIWEVFSEVNVNLFVFGETIH